MNKALVPEPSLQREAQYRNIIERLSHTIVFLAVLILLLLGAFIFAYNRYSQLAANPGPGKQNASVPVTIDHLTDNYVPEAGKPDGRALFEQKCASCHLTSSEPMTGPGLAGVLDRIPGGDWKYAWVKNSAALIRSGDAYANRIYNENKQLNMPMQALSNEEIDAIFQYLDAVR